MYRSRIAVEFVFESTVGKEYSLLAASLTVGHS
jgi:hypothetical protein